MIGKLLALLPLLERLVPLVPMLERHFGGSAMQRASSEAAQMRELEAGMVALLEELSGAAREQRRESLELRARAESLAQQLRIVEEHTHAMEQQVQRMGQQ